MEPFLSASTFANWAKRPAWGTDQLAASLLIVVSDWIRDKKPDIGADDTAAKVVTFEVTRDALLYGDFGPVDSYEKRTAHSSRSASINREAVAKFVNDRHRRMLGISLRAAPRGHFKRCDY